MANGARERTESNGGASAVGASNLKSKRQKHGNNSNNNKIRPVSVETVLRIVAQEGRSARNLISWNAPLFTEETSDSKPKRKPRRSVMKRRSKSCDTTEKKEMESTRSSREVKSNAGKKQVSIRARYWAYLFENLRRAVDEIYATCEADQSVVECKEVLLVFDNYHHEFQALIDWINLQERLNSADITNRPTSLAWEVRKSSPGRPRQRMTPRSNKQGGIYLPGPSHMSPGTSGNTAPSPHIKRSKSDRKNGTTKSSSSTVTWADKVKGVPSGAKANSPKITQKKTPTEPDQKKASGENTELAKSVLVEVTEDDEGWERVSSKNKQPKMNRVSFKNANISDNKPSKGSSIKPVGDIPNNKSVPTQGSKTPSSKPSIVVKDTNSNLVVLNGKPNNERDQEVADNLDFFVDSVGQESPLTPHSGTLSSQGLTPTYGSMVVERAMGTGTASMAASKPTTAPGSETPKVEKEATEAFTDEEHKLHKVLFRDDDSLAENDISLRSLDEVEAEYFKSRPTLASAEDDDDDDDDECMIDESDSKANQALLKHDASIAAAEQEEKELMKEIEEEQKKTIEPETETDSSPATNCNEVSSGNSQENGDWGSIMARFEADQVVHEGMSWGELIEEEELREPGRAVQMHEKLSSPSRRRTPAESKRKMEEKQRSATLRREKMVQHKTERIHVLTEKVNDVKKLKDDLIYERRELLYELHMEKLHRAEQQRAMKLMKIVQKAQAEETKVNEILFINELQEQNKRHDVLTRILEHDARLQEIQQERFKMQEVKAAKEENVKERRRMLEKERQDRLSELINRRKEQDSRIEHLRLEKDKEREKIAREKERERKIRLSALNAAQQEAVTELQKKIQIKHDESERRHQEQLEQRKEKALELSLGRFSLSSSVNLPSGEMQNMLMEGERTSQRPIPPSTSLDLALGENEDIKTGKGDATTSTKGSPRDPVVSPRGINSSKDDKKVTKQREARMRERKKAMKKRAKKLKTRMTSRGRDFQKGVEQKQENPPSSTKNKVYRLVKDVNRQLTNQKESSGPWPANRVSALDRALGEINRLLEKQDQTDKVTFRTSGGFEMIERVLELPLNSTTFQGQKGEPVPVIPDKSLVNAANAFRLACEHCFDNVLYVLYAGRMTVLVDALTQQLSGHFVKDASNSATSAKSPPSSRKLSHGNVTQDVMFDSAAYALLHSLAFCLGLLALEPKVREDDGNINFTENKTLSKALAMTVMTSSRTSSINVDDVDNKRLLEGYLNRGIDVVSYIVSCGVLDKLSDYLGSVKSEIAPESKASLFIKQGLAFLSSVTDFVSLRNRMSSENAEHRIRRTSTSSNASSMSNEKKTGGGDPGPTPLTDPLTWNNDPTQLLPTLYHTELMGVVSVLYGVLLQSAPERPLLLRDTETDAGDDVSSSGPPPKTIPVHVLHIAMSVMRVLNAVADLDIHLLQASLGAEGVSLEFRHICTYLLWYCQHGEYDGLLQAVIVCVGHFALRNRKNQDTVHSGAMPTVLQQLCLLPFVYFSNPTLTDILFPTLIACCHDNPTNLSMLEQEASSCLLSGYIQGVLENRDEDGVDSQNVHVKGENPVSNVHTIISLSSNRLYTVAFLSDALRFFRIQSEDTNKNANDVMCNGVTVPTQSSS